MDKEYIKCLVDDNGWKLAEIQPDEWYMRFRRGKDIFDWWFTTNTVRKIVKGKTTYQRNVTEETIIDFLK